MGTCTVDVGKCPIESHLLNTRRHFLYPSAGVICPKTETQIVDCGVGPQEVEVVKECVCCVGKGINVEGTVST